MRLLFITAFNPSKNDAGSNYTRQLILKLSQKHQIDLLVFKNKNIESFKSSNANIRLLKLYNINMGSRILGAISFPLYFPLFTSRFKWSILLYIKSLIKTNSYDILYFDFSQTFIYSLFIKHPKKLLMSHDVIYQRYLRRGSRLLYWVKWSEKQMLSSAGIIYTFSEKDCKLIKQLYGLKSCSTSFFIQDEAIHAIPSVVKHPYFVFYGNWSRPDNYESLQWFMEKVSPQLNPSIKFKIIGGGLSHNMMSLIKSNSSFEYLGFVDNPYQIIADANALISPLMNGAGVKVKVIESFACGTPVIGTELSFEGIDSKYRAFSIIANTSDEFKNKIESLDISIYEKQNFKDRFIATYNNKPVLNYICCYE